MLWDHAIDEILGRREPVKAVTGMRLRSTKTGETRDLAAGGVFVAIGRDPAAQLFREEVAMEDGNYIRVAPWSTKTPVPGVLAAGDCAESVFRQAVVAAGMGCMAALEAEKFLAEHPVDPAIRAEEKRDPEMIGAYD